MFIKWLQNGGSNSNITELPPAPALESTLPKEIAEPQVPLKRGNYYYSQYDGTLRIPGLSNENDKIVNGDARMYEKSVFANPQYKWLRNRNTGEYFRYEPELNSTLNLSDYDEVSADEIRNILPKRNYIGGEGYRLATVKRVPGLLDMIKNKAMSYGLNPNLLLHRFMKEGIVDKWVREYNGDIDTAEQPNYFNTLMDRSISGWGELGLDDAVHNIEQGLYQLKDPTAEWKLSAFDNKNEQGRWIKDVIASDMNSALEIQAAEMAYRQRELAKRGLTGDSYVNGAYNMGLHNPKLNDPDFMARNYGIPDYGVFKKGGVLSAKSGIHIKKANRGKFTDYCGGKVTSACIAKGKASSNPTIRKRATFAANSRSWSRKHMFGGILNVPNRVDYD